MPGLETLALIISSLATTTFAANALYLGTYAAVLGGLAYVQSMLVDKPSVPKPDDGAFNLKQNVPSDSYVLGWAKKGGDYVFLEERNGTAYHLIVPASHQIDAYIQHYLHDEPVTLAIDGGVLEPGHFNADGDNFVTILERYGLPAETAYAEIVSVFPEIWSNDHRGDGLASVMMACRAVPQKDYMSIYPNQMPQWSAVIAGARLYDPRTTLTVFSRNLALMRLWHLTKPVGGKLTLDDIYLPDFSHAANVCDQTVVNRDGGNEARYYGGFWFRANNDPTEVGRIIDQAGELVVFERPDGLVGVHAGEFVEPDITLTRADVISFQLDGNTRDTSNVLAVRGRYVRLDLDYNLSDAAIYGNPYVDGDDTERTKTIENNAVQSHNHVQRLQKIAFIRANAPRVAIKAHYEPAESVPYRRFVRVNIPPKLNNVIVEITETPKLSLRNLTIDFSGIIVPATLYDFIAATEEGEPGNDVILLENGGVPMPADFDAVIQRDSVSGANNVAYALATWTHYSDDLTYEFQWQPTDESEPPRSILSEAGEDEVRSGYLVDGVEYRFRLRAWGGGTQSEWTGYEELIAVADPIAPPIPTAVDVIVSASDASRAIVSWVAPNSAKYASGKIYRSSTSNVADAVLVDTVWGQANVAGQHLSASLASGRYWYWAAAANASGRESAKVYAGMVNASAYETESTTLFAAMTTAPSATRKSQINTFIQDIKTGGVWAKLAKIAVMGAHAEQAALLNWKAPAGTAFTKSGTITFAVDRGFTGDGVSGHLDSGALWTALATQNDASMWARSLTQAIAGTPLIGTTTAGGGNAYIGPTVSGNFTVRAHGATAAIDAAASSIGFFGWARSLSTAFRAYRGKIETTVTQTSAAMPAGNLSILRTGSSYGPWQVAFAAGGSSLTTAEQAALHDAVELYLSEIGAI
jgi:hypothetical protein